MFINSINIARALAIVLIVLGHNLNNAQIDTSRFSERLFYNLSGGWTPIFVFISGYMFHYVFCKRFVYRKFLIGKFNNVVMPYIIFSIPGIVFALVLGPAIWSRKFGIDFTDSILSQLTASLLYLLSGSFIIAYWYIPFIFTLFLMAPLHRQFIDLRFGVQTAIVASLYAVSLVIHRPSNTLNIPLTILHSVLYFTPVYLTGIMSSQYRAELFRRFEPRMYTFLFVGLAFAVAQSWLGHVDSYHKPLFVWEGLDLMLPQKVSLCFFLILWLHKFENVRSRIIDTIAATSFAIFFIHPYLLILVQRMTMDMQLSELSRWILAFAGTFIEIAIGAAIALSVKYVFPRNSRKLIGY